MATCSSKLATKQQMPDHADEKDTAGEGEKTAAAPVLDPKLAKRVKETGLLLGKAGLFKIDTEFAKGVLEGDDWIARYLKMWKSPKKASAAIMKTVEWRKQEKADEALSWDLKTESGSQYRQMRALNGVLLGRDKEGRPVVYLDFGNADAPGLAKACGGKEAFTAAQKRMEIQKQEFLCTELLEEQRKLDPFCSSGAVGIVDLGGFDRSSMNFTLLNHLKAHAKLTDENYPYATELVYLINVPKFFAIAGKMASAIVRNQNTKYVYHANVTEELLKVMDKETLPRELGGESPYKIGEHPLHKRLETRRTAEI